jgi:hypothetical protein
MARAFDPSRRALLGGSPSGPAKACVRPSSTLDHIDGSSAEPFDPAEVLSRTAAAATGASALILAADAAAQAVGGRTAALAADPSAFDPPARSGTAGWPAEPARKPLRAY